MVQKPRLNLVNSAIACLVALAANVWLIGRFGVIGAAFGILIPYVVLGILRYRTLRLVFRWRNPWHDVGAPLLAAVIAAAPALLVRLTIADMPGQVLAALVFLAVYFVLWKRHRAAEGNVAL